MTKPNFARGIESLIIAFIGLIVIGDGWRMADSFRSAGGFGVVGPDRYLLGIGIGLVAMSVVHLIFGSTPHARAVDVEPHAEKTHPLRAILYGSAALVYALLLPIAGYVLATWLFFVAAFRIGDNRRWWHSVLAGTVAAIAAYALFVHIAGVDFPEGIVPMPGD